MRALDCAADTPPLSGTQPGGAVDTSLSSGLAACSKEWVGAPGVMPGEGDGGASLRKVERLSKFVDEFVDETLSALETRGAVGIGTPVFLLPLRCAPRVP